MKLSGRTILITGGSAGIGLALATEFVRRKNTVIITGRNQQRLDEAQKSVSELKTIQSDASSAADVKALAAKVVQDFPELDVLVNNAGTFVGRNLTSSQDDLDELTREIDVNLKGPIWLTSALTNQLKKTKGTVINVTSGLAFVPLPLGPVYCATKAALHSFTVSLRFQVEAAGIEVIELAPPAVKTDLTSDLPADGDFKMLTTDELVSQTFAGLEAGKNEICPGQASQLRFMSRLAPGFINKQLAKGSKDLIPSA